MSSAGGEEDKKPAGGEGGIHINLKVKGQVCTPAPSFPPSHYPGSRRDRHALGVQFASCGVCISSRRFEAVYLSAVVLGFDCRMLYATR